MDKEKSEPEGGVIERDTSEPHLKPAQVRALPRPRFLAWDFLCTRRDRSAHSSSSGVSGIPEPAPQQILHEGINPRTSKLASRESSDIVALLFDLMSSPYKLVTKIMDDFQDRSATRIALGKLRPLRVLLVLAALSFSAFAETQLDDHLRAIDWPPYQDETVKLMREYLRIDTSNPPGNELAAAEFFHRLFDQAGIPNTIYPYAAGRANIYAVIKGDGTLRPLVLLNHMDVVQADPRSWRLPPFSGEILEGEIYGRGAQDMKDEGLLQAMVMLIAAREHLPLKRDLIFLATSDEEVNGTGSAWMVENHPEAGARRGIPHYRGWLESGYP